MTDTLITQKVKDKAENVEEEKENQTQLMLEEQSN